MVDSHVKPFRFQLRKDDPLPWSVRSRLLRWERVRRDLRDADGVSGIRGVAQAELGRERVGLKIKWSRLKSRLTPPLFVAVRHDDGGRVVVGVSLDRDRAWSYCAEDAYPRGGMIMQEGRGDVADGSVFYTVDVDWEPPVR